MDDDVGKDKPFFYIIGFPSHHSFGLVMVTAVFAIYVPVGKKWVFFQTASNPVRDASFGRVDLDKIPMQAYEIIQCILCSGFCRQEIYFVRQSQICLRQKT